MSTTDARHLSDESAHLAAARKAAGATPHRDGLGEEDLILGTARNLAAEVGLTPVGPTAGAALRLLASVGSARSLVEVGTGTGVSGLWLLRGMRPDGVLTTIDIEREHQRIARRLFTEAGFTGSRTRIITGRALEVLPRLADGGYDLVFVDGDVADHAECVSAARRLLRPGGVVAVHGALAGGRLTDPAARDPFPVTMRDLVSTLLSDEDWLPALLPTDAGLLCAVRTATPVRAGS